MAEVPRFAVVLSDVENSLLVRLPGSYQALVQYLSKVLGIAKEDLALESLQEQGPGKDPVKDEATYQALVADKRKGVRLQASSVGTCNYVLGFAGKDVLKVHNLDTETVFHVQSAGLNWSGRVCMRANDRVFFSGGCDRPKGALELDLRHSQERRLEDMKQSRVWHGLCALDGNVYAVGGRPNLEGIPASTAEVFRAEVWTPLPDLNHNRESISLVANRTTLFAVGGFNGKQRIDSIERLDPGEWTLLVWTLPGPRQMVGVAFLSEDVLVVAGGQNGAEDRTEVCKLNLKTGVRKDLPPLPAADFFNGRQLVLRHPTELWAYGHSVHIFHLQTSRWVTAK